MCFQFFDLAYVVSGQGVTYSRAELEPDEVSDVVVDHFPLFDGRPGGRRRKKGYEIHRSIS